MPTTSLPSGNVHVPSISKLLSRRRGSSTKPWLFRSNKQPRKPPLWHPNTELRACAPSNPQTRSPRPETPCSWSASRRHRPNPSRKNSPFTLLRMNLWEQTRAVPFSFLLLGLPRNHNSQILLQQPPLLLPHCQPHLPPHHSSCL